MKKESILNKRVRLVKMNDEPYPLESGSMGTIIHVGGDVINVKWDNGRYLGLIVGLDEYVILD